jgi:dTDP-L-rhamnose 4-epimerase
MNLNDKTILVTGGAGFIGCAISQILAPLCRRYIAFDSLHPQVHESPHRPLAMHEKSELFVGDVTNASDWDRCLAQIKPDLVFHLAAETGTGQSLFEASRHGEVNVVGTTRMLDALSRHKMVPEQIVLSSSRAVYGEGAWLKQSGTIYYPGQRDDQQLARHAWDFEGSKAALPARASETSNCPTSIYGATKLAQEHLLSAWTQSHSIPLTILRLQNVYGPGQSLKNSYTGILILFARLALSKKTIPIYEDGLMTRDFVYVDDVARAFHLAILADNRKLLVHYDIGSGRAITLLEIANTIARWFDAPNPTITGKYRNGDVRHASCVIEDSVRELGWHPTVSLDNGLTELLSWVERKING